jgi:hypothetical protein
LWRETPLRRLAVGLVGSVTAEGVYAVAVAVFAYKAAGATGVAVVATVQPALAAIASPVASTLGDRFRRERTMVATDLARAAILGAMAAATAAGIDWIVYVLADVLAIVATAFWPAQAALLPSLAREPAQLTAANVVVSTIEGVGGFAGPLLCAALLIVAGPPTLFLLGAVGFLASALTIARVEVAGQRREPHPHAPVLGGFRAIAADHGARIVVLLFAAQMLVAGAMNVLLVIAAIELLHTGKRGVGYLTAAVGIGSLAGVVGAAVLVGSRRLATGFGLGLVLWGVPLALIAAWPSRWVALAALVVAGVGFTLGDVAGFTVLQRAVDDRVLARVFGSLESITLIATAIGAALVSVANGLVGVRGALVAAGAFLPVVTLAAWTRLRALDASSVVAAEPVDLLRTNPIFAPLPPATIDALAARTVAEEHPAGTVIFRQGDAGDRFYVVSAGRIAIEIDGLHVTDAGPGDSFGEIALLQTAPRTATVRAIRDVRLFSLDAPSFISAATGHPASAEAAAAVVGARLRFRSPSGGLV